MTVQDARSYVLEQLGFDAGSSVKVYRQQRVHFDAEKTPVLFDGEHRIDLCLLIADKEAIPLEVKAGTIHRKVIAGRFSHGDKRIAGNMLGILDRQLPEELHNVDLVAQLDGKQYKLSQKWGVIAPKNMIEQWKKSAFKNTQPVFIDIDALCYTAGPESFNAAAKAVLHSEDYFVDWIKGPTDD